MICQMDQNNYCLRHRRVHIGHAATIAMADTPEAEAYRLVWDGGRAVHPKHLLQPSPTPKPFTPLQMLASYTETLTRHIAGGRVMVPVSIHQHRRDTCNACPHRNAEKDACGICGCKLDPTHLEATIIGDKLRWAVAECPVGKWQAWKESEPPKQPLYTAQSRHLLFHIWPRKISAGTWQRNLDQLKQRWSLFTGKRVIAVATSEDSHSLEAVQAYMHGYDCEWITVKNDASLREVATFLPLFQAIEGLPGSTFYAQGKGVTKPINPGVSIHAWTSAMYETLLDYWPLVEEELKRYPVVGSFKKTIYGAFGDDSTSSWHYSGSFCWFRNEELWKRNWKAIEQKWFGIETYPSMIYSRDEAGCIFYARNKQFSLYSAKYWQRVQEELMQWRQSQAAHRTGTGLSTASTIR